MFTKVLVYLLIILAAFFFQVAVAGYTHEGADDQLVYPPIKHAKIIAKLVKIATCESGNKQFNKDGSVIRGKINNNDVGKYQINLTYHEKQASKLGYDLFTEEGNTNYAIWLYEKEGDKPWDWSRSCWEE